MATLTIVDLLSSRALDYQAMLAIRGAGLGDWVLSAFLPYQPPAAQIVNFYQTNYIADNLTLQTENIDIKNSGPSAAISVGALQNALPVNIVPVSPHP
jgi:hypothetical protein